jgi:secreted trypsin-like serine protease
MAIVGGSNAAAGEFPSIAEITFGNAFLCTGTLISPTYVLTAGHCNSMTGTAVATPVGWPAPLITVRIGSNKPGQGTRYTVKRTVGHPNYLATSGYDIALLELQTPATQAPTKVSGSAETAAWGVGVMETIVGWGTTSEGGSTPNTLQKAQVPIVSDASCEQSYEDDGGIDPATMICAGFPNGGVDTCQGDSGGPMFGTAGGQRRVVGTTSFGVGCARPEYPGVYGRVGDSLLREWIRSQVPAGVA